jgi:tripartite-type tricarboxylate transporter receptor subunit TctC
MLVRIKALVAAALFAMSAGQAVAAYPQRAVTVVVPWPAGGAVDAAARLVGEKLSTALGQPVVVENRPGASGNIGAAAVSRAGPDGHTIVLTSAAISVSAATHPSPGFKLFEDLRPVTIVGETPFVLVVVPSVPANNVEEFIAYARQNPGKLNFGSSTKGTVLHLAGELFRQRADIDFLSVPFTAGVQGVTELIAGRLDFMIEVITNVKPYIEDQKIRLLGVATAARLADFPDAPTLSESGLPGLEASTWFGLFAPRATPDSVVERLNTEVVRIVNSDEVKAGLGLVGINAIANSPTDADRFVRQEVQKWTEVARNAGLKP